MADPRVVLVTGASSGIGRACAEHLAGRGFRVFGASRRPPSVALPGLADPWLTMDVREEDAVERGVLQAVVAAGRLDAVVCCAGYSVFGSVEELAVAKAREQIETNLVGTLTVLRATLPHLRSTRGRAVVVGSLAGRAPIPFQAHYSATKAALDALTLALRVEVAPFGVGVCLVEPGDIRTAFNENMDWGDAGARARSAYAERLTTLRRRGSRIPAVGPGTGGRGRGRAPRPHRPKAEGALRGGARFAGRPLGTATPTRLGHPGPHPASLQGLTLGASSLSGR